MAPQREWFEKDYYKVLGVSDSATKAEITKAYRKLARESHPDQHPGDTAAEDRFKEISAAYDVLGDDAKRKEYDEVRRMGPLGGMGGGRGGGGQPGGFRFEDASDLGDLFGGLFNRGRGGGGGGGRTRRGTGPQRGADLQSELHLTFEDAVSGVTTAVHLTSEAACSRCSGNGAEPGTTPLVCTNCGGRGVLDDNQGFFSFSQPCPTCQGRGTIVETPCTNCRGSGIEHRPREVKVRVPAGVQDGQRIRLKGRGGPGRNGGPPGDLHVIVHVGPHRLFGRSGDDLTLTVPVTFAEAALGADIEVPTLDEPVKIRVPAGTKSGKVFRVGGKGVSRNGKTGSLLVTIEVAVPAKLSRDERKAIEALASLETESPRKHLGV
ncbi:molecular chaperone DnaJ [Acidimicrobiia bacterium EGI L10123]|uniref:molecular chaperone DnaJ n=1 Tax=Salinilacustrithrix flava TaxID=2957203 RepID=UPI003D7C17DC|nr:molecular chaperone DnaJ [Acidimicrobiia bacterium EGI L10123]